MDKVKIQEIAEEAGLSNGDLLDKAKELGFDVIAANSTISFDDAGILVDYAISGTLPKGFKKLKKKDKIIVIQKKDEMVEERPAKKQRILRERRGITIVNKAKELTSIRKSNQNIKDTVGLSKVDLACRSKELEKREIIVKEVKKNNQIFLNLIKCSYEKTDDSEFTYLNIILTPMDLLKSDERFKRAQLYQRTNQEIKLKIMHDRFHEDDHRSLEVYYDQIFIGYVRKVFNKEKIDKTNIVNEFCFDESKLRNIKIYWNGEKFILRKKKQVKDKTNEIENTIESNYW